MIFPQFSNTISHDSQRLSAGFDTIRTNARKLFYYDSNNFQQSFSQFTLKFL